MAFNQTSQTYVNMESPRSVLRLILFLSFINDINKSSEHIFLKLFADDTNYYIYGNNFNQLERLAEV